MRFPFKYCSLLFVFLFPFLLHAQNADIRLLRTFNNPQRLSSDVFFLGISESVNPLALTVPLKHLAIGLLGKKNKCEKLHTIVQPALGVGVPMLVTYGLKHLFNRTRPFVTYPDIVAKDHVGPESFPSGHTTAAFATATTLTLQYKKWYVWVPAYLWAATVAYSRMHLGVHYPSDVISGALIGTGLSFLSYKLSGRFLNKRVPACRDL